MTDHAPEYLAARRTLLDALAALEPHLANLIRWERKPSTCTQELVTSALHP